MKKSGESYIGRFFCCSRVGVVLWLGCSWAGLGFAAAGVLGSCHGWLVGALLCLAGWGSAVSGWAWVLLCLAGLGPAVVSGLGSCCGWLGLGPAVAGGLEFCCGWWVAVLLWFAGLGSAVVRLRTL